MPSIRNCRLRFLQKILSDEKDVLKTHEVKVRNFNPNYAEYAVKNVWHLVRNAEEIQEYMPLDEMRLGRFPDKQWFWGVCFTLIPAWARSYDKKVKDIRASQNKVNIRDETKLIRVSDKWLDDLRRYDYKSRGK